MSRNVSVTEPHPSIPRTGNSFVYAGRGGAGNYQRYAADSLTSGPTATGPASKISLTRAFKRPSAASSPNASTTSSSRSIGVPMGRGGAGNMSIFPRVDTEERVFQFDEEMVKRREATTPIYHIGRGGAANWVDERRTARAGSLSSEDSDKSDVRRSVGGALEKLARKISRDSTS